VKSLVTGGAGFIGSHLVDRLVMEGHEVLVLDDLSHGRRKQVNKAARFAKVDIRSPKVDAQIRKFRPQVVFHMAAQMEVRKSVENPMLDADINILGLVNVLKAAVEGGCPRVLFASSGGAVYGEQEAFPATEDHPTRPLSPYGVTKRAGELYCGYFATLGLRCASMRLANVYGPRQDPHGEAGVVAIFSEMMLAGKTPTINGTGKQTRDYVYVEDVVEAFMAALANGLEGPCNVGTGVETDVNALAGLIAKQAGFTGAPIHGPAKEGEQMRSMLSAARLTQATDWEARTLLEEGIARTVDWFRDPRR
jgi:UDP-glucose 4-epimerase